VRARRRWTVRAGSAVAAVLAVLTAPLGSPLSSGAAKPPSPQLAGSGAQVLLFRSTLLNRTYGRVAVVPASDPSGRRVLTPLTCDRVAFAGGRGVCLVRSLTGGTYARPRAVVFNGRFQTLHTINLTGYPSRTQVSSNGRFGATTTFVGGDTYAAPGFSTSTNMLDLRAGRILYNLDALHVSEGGKPIANSDFQFWGVTFAPDSRHFYATLGTQGSTDLIEGDVVTRQAHVLRSGVECPSLSPDGTEIAFKSRNPGTPVTWRVSVLDLRTLAAHPLAETRDVDDQVAWLNSTTVMYGLPRSAGANAQIATGLSELTAGGSIPTDTWAVPSDGSGQPRLLISGAWSTMPVAGRI
jgi:hypothetical protein